MNNAEIMGRLTRDPQVVQVKGGGVKVTIGIADNRRWTDRVTGEVRETVLFHNCESWDPGFVKNLPASLKMGQAVVVTGHFEPNNYETTETNDAGETIKVRVYGQRLRITTIGPDLRFQSAVVTKNARADAPPAEVAETEAVEVTTEAPAEAEAEAVPVPVGASTEEAY